MIHPIRHPDRARQCARWSILFATALWGAIIITYVAVRGFA